jgi:hypothetical protein
MNAKKVSNKEEMMELKQEFEKKKMHKDMRLVNLKSDEEHMKAWRFPESPVTNKKSMLRNPDSVSMIRQQQKSGTDNDQLSESSDFGTKSQNKLMMRKSNDSTTSPSRKMISKSKRIAEEQEHRIKKKSEIKQGEMMVEDQPGASRPKKVPRITTASTVEKQQQPKKYDVYLKEKEEAYPKQKQQTAVGNKNKAQKLDDTMIINITSPAKSELTSITDSPRKEEKKKKIVRKTLSTSVEVVTIDSPTSNRSKTNETKEIATKIGEEGNVTKSDDLKQKSASDNSPNKPTDKWLRSESNKKESISDTDKSPGKMNKVISGRVHKDK